MTASDVLRLAGVCGVQLAVREDCIVVRGRADRIEALKPELTAHRDDLIALIREHTETAATGAVLTAQRFLLRTR